MSLFKNIERKGDSNDQLQLFKVKRKDQREL